MIKKLVKSDNINGHNVNTFNTKHKSFFATWNKHIKALDCPSNVDTRAFQVKKTASYVRSASYPPPEGYFTGLRQ